MTINSMNLWNRDQWTFIRYPRNWLSWKRDYPGGPFVLTILGFVIWFYPRGAA